MREPRNFQFNTGDSNSKLILLRER